SAYPRPVAADGAGTDLQPPGVVDAAAGAAREDDIAGEGAVADRQRPGVVDAPAGANAARVVGEGAVADREQAGVVDAAPLQRQVPREGAVTERQGAVIADAPPGVCLAVSDGKPRDHDGGGTVYREDAVIPPGVAAHRQAGGAGALEVDVAPQA